MFNYLNLKKEKKSKFAQSKNQNNFQNEDLKFILSYYFSNVIMIFKTMVDCNNSKLDTDTKRTGTEG